jgi:hypothetical protein
MTNLYRAPRCVSRPRFIALYRPIPIQFTTEPLDPLGHLAGLRCPRCIWHSRIAALIKHVKVRG